MKKCIRCSAENNSEYKYCKFCGAELPCVDKKVYFQSTADNNAEDMEKAFASEDIGISEMVAFVGKNNGQIVPKFIWLQQNGKKLSWCLPAFLFGLFFGLPGLAIWFLYRKMTKPAVWMLIAATVVSVIEMILSFGVLSEYYSSMLSAADFYGGLMAEDPTAALQGLTEYMNELTDWLASAMTGAVPAVVSLFTDYAINLAAPIIISFFALSVYKDYSLKKISKLKRESPSAAVYMACLRGRGGTSVGYAVFGVILYIAVSLLISAVPLIAAVTV